MYKKVETIHDLNTFEKIYQSTCDELGIKAEPSLNPSYRFLILDDDGFDAIGTVEIVPRNPDNFSIVDSYYSFENHPLLHNDLSKVFEIGKIGIVPNKRGKKHVQKIVNLLYCFIVEKEAEQYIAVINKDFYRLLSLQFKVRLQRVDDEIYTGNNVTAVPIIGDCNKIRKILESNGIKELVKEKALV